jgi:GAF domain-containing protein
MKPAPLERALADAVLEVSRERSLPAVIERLLTMVMEVVPAADAAAVLVWDRSVPTGVVATDEPVRELVERHVANGRTPSESARQQRRPIHSRDLGRDLRWPEFSRDMTASLGINSLLAVPMAVHEVPLGALTTYGKRAEAFDPEDEEIVQIAAIHATAALADALEKRQLSRGLETRTVIGQATGIVMQQFDLDATTAFSVLRRLSQHNNVKIRDLAARIVETRVIQ